MPWKGEKDPYRIWISEIILQQTRVEQGLNYYQKFIEAFPSINQLAQSPEQKVFKLWEGLGYYSRCRNLIVSARYIADQLKGEFPSSYEQIRQLKGIGPYTAAAISSFAFNLPHAVVDGNVYRVLSRVFGFNEAVDTAPGKKVFNELANELLDKKEPGLYNQAIMDFGATVCKPGAPLCKDCVFNKNCFAFLNNRIDDFPFKQNKTAISKRWFYYLVIKNKNQSKTWQFPIRKRTSKDIWQDLYEFPLVETKKELNTSFVLKRAEKHTGLQRKHYTLLTISPVFKQQLSHQLISGQFIIIQLKRKQFPKNDWLWVTKSKLVKYPFPGYINQFLRNKLFGLEG